MQLNPVVTDSGKQDSFKNVYYIFLATIVSINACLLIFIWYVIDNKKNRKSLSSNKKKAVLVTLFCHLGLEKCPFSLNFGVLGWNHIYGRKKLPFLAPFAGGYEICYTNSPRGRNSSQDPNSPKFAAQKLLFSHYFCSGLNGKRTCNNFSSNRFI